MINNYEVKKENNEEILYLYFDFNLEFAKIKGKNKRKKINEIIKEYIKENKIKFNGKKVAIIAGGLLIGTLIINKPVQNQENILPQTKIVSLIDQDEIDENIEQIVIDTKEENISVNESEDSSIKNSTTTTKINEKKDEVKTNTSDDSTNSNQTSQNQIEENKTYVTLYRKNNTLTIELEEYIVGVVGAEMPASFNKEALKAQAVLARTYALKSIKNNTRLTDSSSTQNYKSVDELKNMWNTSFNTYYQKIVSAVNETKGMVLTYNGDLIEAVYHSTSNGKTEDAVNVWGNSFPYLVSVESNYDNTNPSFLKDQFISYAEISNKLSMNINIDTNFEILSKTIGDRVDVIKINDVSYSGVEVRSLLGLRSADFSIIKNENGVVFQTKGYGHGVGMSQYGANGMAKNGYNYSQILSHYYPKTTLKS